jgi:hypothetical protein
MKKIKFLFLVSAFLLINYQSVFSQYFSITPSNYVVEINTEFESPIGTFSHSFNSNLQYYVTVTSTTYLTVNDVFADLNNNGTFDANESINNSIPFSVPQGTTSLSVIAIVDLGANASHCDDYTLTFSLYENSTQTLITYGSLTVEASSIPNITGGLRPEGVDLMMRDFTNDQGRERNTDTKWAEAFKSPDLWNRRTTGTPVPTDHQNPDYSQQNYNKAYVRIWNIGCTDFDVTENYADVHIYWTIARSGEEWPKHWKHYSNADASENNAPDIRYQNIIRPLGSEITISNKDDYSSSSDPVELPDIDCGDSYIIPEVEWKAPDPDWYTLDPEFNPPVICLLARIVSDIDPIEDDPERSDVYNYIKDYNNVVTRNTFLTDVSGFLVGTGGSNWKTNWVNTAVNVNEPNVDINLIVMNLTDESETDDITDFASFKIKLDSTLYEEWAGNNGTVEGADTIDYGLFDVTEPDKITFYDIPYDTGMLNSVSFQFEFNASQLDGYVHTYYYGFTHQIIDQGDTSYGNPVILRAVVPATSPFGGGPIITSVVDVENENQINIFPNPFKDNINILFDNLNSKVIYVKLFNAEGKLIKSEEFINNGAKMYDLNTQELTSGIYVLKIYNGNYESEFKLLKK